MADFQTASQRALQSALNRLAAAKAAGIKAAQGAVPLAVRSVNTVPIDPKTGMPPKTSTATMVVRPPLQTQKASGYPTHTKPGDVGWAANYAQVAQGVQPPTTVLSNGQPRLVPDAGPTPRVITATVPRPPQQPGWGQPVVMPTLVSDPSVNPRQVYQPVSNEASLAARRPALGAALGWNNNAYPTSAALKAIDVSTSPRVVGQELNAGNALFPGGLVARLKEQLRPRLPVGAPIEANAYSGAQQVAGQHALVPGPDRQVMNAMQQSSGINSNAFLRALIPSTLGTLQERNAGTIGLAALGGSSGLTGAAINYNTMTQAEAEAEAARIAQGMNRKRLAAA